MAHDPTEAHLVKGLLEANGIAALVRGSVAGQTLFFGFSFHVTGVPTNMLVAVAGSAIAEPFARNPLFERLRNWLAGTVLIGLGVRLALSERR